MRFTAGFSIVIGLSMFTQWLLFYVSGQIIELQTEPIRIAFHLAAEFLTALGLILGGAGLWAGKDWARPLCLVALGMLLYTAIASPGYFAQMGEWGWLGLFGAILAGGLVSILLLQRTGPLSE